MIVLDPKLLRFYKKKLYGGRSIAARITDFIAFRLFLLFVIFIAVLYLSLSTTVALLIAIFLTTAASLALTAYNRKKTERFILKDILRLKRKCLLEKLTFMGSDEFAQYINRLLDGSIKNITITGDGFYGVLKDRCIYALHCHPSSECGVSDVLRIIRSNKSGDILILSLSEFSNEVKAMCSSLAFSVELMCGKDVLSLADKMGMLPDENEAQKSAEKEMKQNILTLEQVKDSAFSKTKIKGYIICGIVIMCWPLISGFRIYYPIIAIACFAMALLTYRKSKKTKESSDIGIS